MLGFVGVPVVTSLVGAGKIQPLFITSQSRSAMLPMVPTAAQVGLADFAMDNWNAVFGPANLPPGVVVALDRALDAAMASTSVREQFVRAGVDPKRSTGRQLAALITDEKERWGQLIRTSGVKVD